MRTWSILNVAVILAINVQYGIQAIQQIQVGKFELNSKSCGVIGLNRRIINGKKDLKHQFPWIVHLTIHLDNANQYTICAGSLITPQHVLTAGHCMRMNGKDPYKIIAHYGNTQYKKGTPILITKFLLNRGFQMKNFRNDIAVLYLPEPLKLSNKISTICLPFPAEDLANKIATVAGWGTVDKPGTVAEPKGSDDLYHTSLQIWSTNACKTHRILKKSFFEREQICAYGTDTDACQGDSGGPFMVEQDQRMVLVGLVSYGYDCAKPDMPSAFTHVTNYIDWIKNAIATPMSGYTSVGMLQKK